MKTTETLANEIKTIKAQMNGITKAAAELEKLAFNQGTETASANLYDASNLLDEANRKLRETLGYLTAELNYQNAIIMAKAEIEKGERRLNAIANASETYGLMDSLVYRMMNEIAYK